jgi:hypothetical protein
MYDININNNIKIDADKDKYIKSKYTELGIDIDKIEID